MLRNTVFLLLIFLCSFLGTQSFAQADALKTIIEDKTHFSEVFNETRHFRMFLPPGYYSHPERRYPVIYYFHGFGGRYFGAEIGHEGRHYDKFTGDYTLCGPDSLDNIAEFVRTHDVIVAKWDGYVKGHYPRPYNLAREFEIVILKKVPPEDDRQFIDYYPEFVKLVDSSYRTIAKREGRAVSGLSMGGYMSLFVASKYPHLITSASSFCPSAGFITGPQAIKIYLPLEEMGKNFIGLPIRMHIGVKDFLRQPDLDMDRNYKTLELNYEGWHYGVRYSNGYHDIVNIDDQFDFHMKNFRQPLPKPAKWYHNDLYPDFEVWNYRINSDRKIAGFTLIEDASKQGFILTCRKWLPDGSPIPEINFKVATDTIYQPNREYQMITLNKADRKIRKEKLQSDETGRLLLNLKGGGSDVGIFLPNDPGFISMADFKMNVKMPKAGEKITLTPILFNKGGRNVDSINIDLVSLDEDLEVLTPAKTTGAIEPGSLQQQASFIIRSGNNKLDCAKLKLVVVYNGKKDQFLFEVRFHNPEAILREFKISDGKKFNQKLEGEVLFGEGNRDGIVNPGEWISVLTRLDQKNAWWNGLRLFTNDPYVDATKARIKYILKYNGAGTMNSTSEVYIKPECPKGHVIRFYGYYEFQKKGDNDRWDNGEHLDEQGSHSYLHGRKRVVFNVIVGGK